MSIHRLARQPGSTIPAELHSPGVRWVFKHSPACPTSLRALGEVSRYAQRHDDVPVVLIDVLTQRETSQRVADTLGIGHASPQVILLRDGTALWSASHFAISVGAMETALAGREDVAAVHGP
ncbi:MAG TPA: bacillithiol system redox-active protein YtxJ [Gemmatimonadaceae bacterium]|nr:bacillithiol system redox-active protein YtxJ [Gemmatimonadaceae bacterium]